MAREGRLAEGVETSGGLWWGLATPPRKAKTAHTLESRKAHEGCRGKRFCAAHDAARLSKCDSRDRIRGSEVVGKALEGRGSLREERSSSSGGGSKRREGHTGKPTNGMPGASEPEGRDFSLSRDSVRHRNPMRVTTGTFGNASVDNLAQRLGGPQQA